MDYIDFVDYLKINAGYKGRSFAKGENCFKLDILQNDRSIYLDCGIFYSYLNLVPSSFKLTKDTNLNNLLVFLMYNSKELGVSFVKEFPNQSTWFGASFIIQVKKYNSLLSFGKELLIK